MRSDGIYRRESRMMSKSAAFSQAPEPGGAAFRTSLFYVLKKAKTAGNCEQVFPALSISETGLV
jgi:hypothetical protein